MARQVFDYDPPDRFVVGTVGEPGERTFYLQARAAGRVTSVALEKVQVAALVDGMDRLLAEVARAGVELPPGEGDEDLAPLDGPVEEDFRVGTLRLAWDADDGRVVIEAEAAGESPEEPAADPEIDSDRDLLRVRFGADLARAFARRAARVVAAGRPPCPLCGQPLNPDGHICPRLNGQRH